MSRQREQLVFPQENKVLSQTKLISKIRSEKQQLKEDIQMEKEKLMLEYKIMKENSKNSLPDSEKSENWLGWVYYYLGYA
jgi:hypothetical protein